MRRLPAGMQAARRPAWALLRARVRGRAGRAHDLRAFEWLLRRSDREEAAEPLPPRHVGALVRDRWLQPRRASSARTGTSRSRARPIRSPTRRRPRRSPRAAQALGCRSVAFTYNDPVIFMEYAIDVAEACRAAGVQTVAVTAGYMCDAPRREFYRAHGRGERRPEGVHRRLLPSRDRRPSRTRARDARVPQARDERLVRADDAAHSRPQRLRRRARRA